MPGSRAEATAANAFPRPLSPTASPAPTPNDPTGFILPSPSSRWWLLLWGVLQACPTQGSVLLAQQLPQQLTSPRYPEPYLKGQESTTVIEAPKGYAVRLVFQEFDLEPSQDCEQDSVTVSWGGGPGGTLGREPPVLEPGAVGGGHALNLRGWMTSPGQGNRPVYPRGKGLPQYTASTSSPVPACAAILATKGHINTTNP